jgi:hypothetical protein
MQAHLPDRLRPFALSVVTRPPYELGSFFLVLTLCGLRIFATWNPAHAAECRRRGWLEVDQHAVPFDSSYK